MYIAKIVGTVVSTRKNDNLTGKKILIVQPISVKFEPEGKCEVAIDSVGAGVGEIVIVATGSSARRAFISSDSPEEAPIDRAIIAIIDSIEVSL